MTKYDIFFFDLDGTITDSSVGITNSVMYALKKFGIVEEDRTKLYQFIGPPLTDSSQRYYGFSEEESWQAVEYYREYYREKGIYENRVYEGLEETVKTVSYTHLDVYKRQEQMCICILTFPMIRNLRRNR